MSKTDWRNNKIIEWRRNVFRDFASLTLKTGTSPFTKVFVHWRPDKMLGYQSSWSIGSGITEAMNIIKYLTSEGWRRVRARMVTACVTVQRFVVSRNRNLNDRELNRDLEVFEVPSRFLDCVRFLNWSWNWVNARQWVSNYIVFPGNVSYICSKLGNKI